MEPDSTLIESCERQLKGLSQLVADASHLIGKDSAELAEMVEKLRETLSKYGLRKKDFDTMMDETLEDRRSTARSLREEISGLWEDVKKSAAALKRAAANNDEGMIKASIEIVRRQRQREKAIAKLLMKMELEDMLLRDAFRNLLSMGEKMRVKHLKASINILRTRQRDMEAMDLIGSIESASAKVFGRWANLLSVYNR